MPHEYRSSIEFAESGVHEKRKWARLTRVCNNHCIFCLDEEAQNGTILPFSSILKDLSQGIKEGCRRAVLSGGDPTVHPNLIRIIRSAHLMGYGHIQIITNGRMFCYADLLKKAVAAGLDEITFSIHSSVPETNDRLTGVKGSLTQSMAALKNAMSIPGLIVNCDIVVNRLNVDSLARHIRNLFLYGVREFDILHIMPFGRAWNNWNELYYDPFEKRKELFDAFSIRENPGVHLWTNRFPAELFEGCEELIQSPLKLIYEIMGRGKEFAEFLSGREMPCSGRRCDYCVLKRFCKDMRSLREDKVLNAFPMPPCVADPNYDGDVCASLEMPLETLARFYIEKRHFVKSSVCGKCRFNQNCHGVPELYAMRHGFSCMNPIMTDGECGK